jgi:predicted lipase
MFDTYSKKTSNLRFLVTGISLGGALAALASYDLSVLFRNSQRKANFLFYTFGQPRIGNQEFINVIDQEEVPIFRVVNANDPVPHLPPRSFMDTYYYNPGV